MLLAFLEARNLICELDNRREKMNGFARLSTEEDGVYNRYTKNLLMSVKVNAAHHYYFNTN
eukprot:c48742_g1_i1 orf=173-355(+)